MGWMIVSTLAACKTGFIAGYGFRISICRYEITRPGADNLSESAVLSRLTRLG